MSHLKKLVIILPIIILLTAALGFYFLSRNQSFLSQEEIEKIVLSDAKIEANQVQFTAISLDKDEQPATYELEFQANNMEYDYQVKAKSGDIISKSSETLTTNQTNSTSSAMSSSSDQAAASSSQIEITTDQALESGTKVIPNSIYAMRIYETQWLSGL